MKTIIKKSILAILFAIGIFLLLAECETFEQTLFTKFLFLLDAILMGSLWQWWHMDKEYKSFLEED